MALPLPPTFDNEVPTCACKITNVVYRLNSDDTKHYLLQCNRCGQATQVKKDHPRIMLEGIHAEPLDRYKQEVWNRYDWEARRRANLAERQENQERWWRRYNEYLLSDTWKEKRRRVLKRDNYQCQACLNRKAEHVHHLTYDRVFNEPLFDLTSVCTPCHKALHPHRSFDNGSD